MRYIYYIILIFLALSAALGFELFSSPVPKKDTAMIINGQVITIKEFNRFCSSPSFRNFYTKRAAADSLITRELLIQEAQREGIDKEESFRRSIKNFYEQSLIKLLMDRKFDSLKVPVSDRELDRYVSFLGRKVYLTVFTTDNMDDAEKGDFKDTEKREMNFDDLSSDIRDRIFMLKQGEKTGPIREGGKFIVLRLDKAENPPHAPKVVPEQKREKIRAMLVAAKKERIIDEWIAGLKKKATVKIMLNLKD